MVLSLPKKVCAYKVNLFGFSSIVCWCNSMVFLRGQRDFEPHRLLWAEGFTWRRRPFFCSLQEVAKLTPTTLDGLRSHLTVIWVNRMDSMFVGSFCHCLFKTFPTRCYTYFTPYKVLSMANRLKKWPLSLSGDNLMSTQVTYMRETPREYYKLECNEVLNWMRQTIRLVSPLWKVDALAGWRWLGKLCRWNSVTEPNVSHDTVSVLMPGVGDGLG